MKIQIEMKFEVEVTCSLNVRPWYEHSKKVETKRLEHFYCPTIQDNAKTSPGKIQQQQLQHMPSLSSLLMGVGSVLLLHAAYSCLHYRGLLQDFDLQESVSIPPVDIYIEVGIAFASILIAELTSGGSLQTVDVTGGNKKRRPLVAPAYRTREFDIYANRSKALNTKKAT